MALALVFNPGSNSLKFELIDCEPGQEFASEAKKLASAAIDGVGKESKLSVHNGNGLVPEADIRAEDMSEAARAALTWLRQREDLQEVLRHLAFAAVRVVHGGSSYDTAACVTPEVRHTIKALEELAPLHNQSSMAVLDVLSKDLPQIPAFVTFDTAFHRTLPEYAWRYPIARETADLHGIRKFGFHGVSHRYMLEQYARTVRKKPKEISLVTLHLESGSSACVIREGKSMDTTMGFTPLEGLMMGSRSGSIDPAIVPFLARKEHKSADEILTLLNKKSGLLGVAGETLDTRELVKRDDHWAKLALEMYSYRVRLTVGAYLAALGNAEAVLFGGGIGEDSPWLREAVCRGLGGWGLEFDAEANRSTAGMCRIAREGSRLQAWAMPVEECLQIAHECLQVFANNSNASLN